MSETNYPPRGGISKERLCSRWTGGTLGAGDEEQCGRPAITHIVWSFDPDGANAGFCCAEHLAEVIAVGWTHATRHTMGDACGMPGALIYENPDGTTFCAEGPIDTAEPERTIAAEAKQ